MTADPDINPHDSEYLKRPDVQGHLKVQQVLREWDPIGLSVMGLTHALEDEYNGYAYGLMKLLNHRASVEELTQHLVDVADQSMGISVDKDRTRRLMIELSSWWHDWKDSLDS